MKKFLALLLIGILMMTGCSSNTAEEEAQAEEIITLSEDGEWQGSNYVLTEYYFMFQKPENWTALLPSEIDDVFGKGSSKKYKMIVVNNTQQIIISMFFEDSKGMSQKNYAKKIRSSMKNSTDTTYKFGDVETVVVGGMEFAKLPSNIEKGGEEGALSNQMLLAHEQGNRMLCVNIKYAKEYEEVVKTTLNENFLNSMEVLAAPENQETGTPEETENTDNTENTVG